MPHVNPYRVWITGASSGIGKALARVYAARGAVLGLVGRREDALIELTASLGSGHRWYVADVRDSARMIQVATDFLHDVGSPDLVIGNAGISIGTDTREADSDNFREVLDTNVVGLFNTFHPFLGQLSRGAQLVGIASVAGYRGLPGAGAYSASKAAAIAYLESLRIELASSGIAVTTICPGYIRTPMTRANPYPMPFIIAADDAAARIARAIDSGTSYAVIPWQMAIVAKLLRALPNWLLDWALADVPRKPRRQ